MSSIKYQIFVKVMKYRKLTIEELKDMELQDLIAAITIVDRPKSDKKKKKSKD